MPNMINLEAPLADCADDSFDDGIRIDTHLEPLAGPGGVVKPNEDDERSPTGSPSAAGLPLLSRRRGRDVAGVHASVNQLRAPGHGGA